MRFRELTMIEFNIRHFVLFLFNFKHTVQHKFYQVSGVFIE